MSSQNQVSDLKSEISKLEARLKNNYDQLILATSDIAYHKCEKENFQKANILLQEENEKLKQQNTEITNQSNKYFSEIGGFSNQVRLLTIQKDDLLAKNKNLELKLYKLGQTEQTIHLNAPKELCSKAGLGFNNPKKLENAIYKAPTLYKFEYMDLDPKYKVQFMKSSPKVERREDWNRKNKKYHQIPFCYPTDVEQISKDTTLSNDYFPSYTDEELQTTPPEYKPYIPTLFLEEKIVQLENILENERSSSEKEKEALITKIQILENKEQQSFEKLSASNISTCKAFVSSYLDDCQEYFKMDPNLCPPTSDYEKDKEIDALEGKVSYDLSSQSSSSKSIVNFDFDLELPSHESYIDKGKSPIESVYVPDVENKCSINTSIPSSSQQKEQTTGLNKTNAHSKTNNHSVNNSSSSVKSNSYFNSSNSNSYSTSRTHKSTLYHNDFVAHSGNFKKFKMVWKKKSTTDDSIGNMSHTSPVVDARSFVSKTNLPYFGRSINQLISLSATNLCCSTCGTNDFIDRRFSHKWYGTYSIPTSEFFASKANLRGPNKVWVPKSF